MRRTRAVGFYVMLEILFLFRFCRRLSQIAKEKGRSSGWGGLGALFWFGGEILGFFLGAAATNEVGGGTYLIALVCAAFGATAAWLIVKNLRAIDEPIPMAFASAGAGAPAGPVQPPDLSNPYAPPRT